MLARHRAGHIHAQAAAQPLLVALKHPVEFLELGQQLFAAFVVGDPVLGHLHLAGGSVQQASAQCALQRLHGARDRGLAQAETLRGPGEAGLLRHADKDLHRLELIHGSRQADCSPYMDSYNRKEGLYGFLER